MTRDLQQCGMCDQQNLRSACTYVQSDQSLCLSLEYSITVMLLTEHHLEFLSSKGGCTGLSELHLSKCQVVGNLKPRLKLCQDQCIGSITSPWASIKLCCFHAPGYKVNGLNPELTKQPEAQENKKCRIISCPLVLCIYKRM